MIRPSEYRAAKDYVTLQEDAQLADVIKNYNELVTDLSTFNKKISIRSNFDGYIAEDVVLAAGTTVNIQHFLGVKPKWRIILKQVGNGVISDIPSSWTDKVISLKNNGAEEVTISVFIARE